MEIIPSDVVDILTKYGIDKELAERGIPDMPEFLVIVAARLLDLEKKIESHNKLMGEEKSEIKRLYDSVKVSLEGYEDVFYKTDNSFNNVDNEIDHIICELNKINNQLRILGKKNE